MKEFIVGLIFGAVVGAAVLTAITYAIVEPAPAVCFTDTECEELVGRPIEL